VVQACAALVRLCVCLVQCESNWFTVCPLDCRDLVWASVWVQDAVVWDRLWCWTSYLLRRRLFTFVSSLIDASNRTVGKRACSQLNWFAATCRRSVASVLHRSSGLLAMLGFTGFSYLCTRSSFGQCRGWNIVEEACGFALEPGRPCRSDLPECCSLGPHGRLCRGMGIQKEQAPFLSADFISCEGI
jgi:hypothetical protein